MTNRRREANLTGAAETMRKVLDYFRADGDSPKDARVRCRMEGAVIATELADRRGAGKAFRDPFQVIPYTIMNAGPVDEGVGGQGERVERGAHDSSVVKPGPDRQAGACG